MDDKKSSQSDARKERELWYMHEYVSSIRDIHDDKLNKKIKEFKNNDELLLGSAMSRSIPIEIAKLYFGFDKYNTETVVFTYEGTKHRINYAYLYFPPGYETYMCYGFGYSSYEGEYRSMLVPLKHLELISQYKDLWDQLVKYIKPKIRGEISYNVYTGLGETSKPNMNNAQQIKKHKYAEKLFVLSWFLELMAVRDKTIPENALGFYKTIFTHHMHEDVQFINKLNLPTDEFKYKLSHMHGCIFGQKLVPLSLCKPGNVRYTPWREVYILKQMNTLTVNYISPSFPIFSDWFYITAANVCNIIIPNDKLDNRFKRSKVYRNITNALRDAAHFTYTGTNIISNEHEQRRYKYPKKFAHFSLWNTHNKIQDLANSLTHHIYSDKILAHVTEHVGIIMSEVPYMIKTLPEYKDTFEVHTFSKYMFELIYALYCMNSMGIIHGDMSPHNTTIRITSSRITKNSHVLYTVNKKSYIFPHNGKYLTLIDFSRGILHSSKFSEPVDKESFINELMNKYGNWADITPIQFDQIKMAATKHYDSIWKVLTAFDILGYISFIKARLYKYKKLDITIDAGTDKLIHKIYSQAMHYVTHVFSYKNKDFPNLTILQDCFASYQADRTKNIDDVVIVDIYNHDNPIKYKLDKYVNFPLYLKTWHGVASDTSLYKQTNIRHDKDIERRKKFEQTILNTNS